MKCARDGCRAFLLPPFREVVLQSKLVSTKAHIPVGIAVLALAPQSASASRQFFALRSASALE